MTRRRANPGDEALRALERARAAGDPGAAMALHVERARRGLPLIPDRTYPPPIAGLPGPTRAYDLPNGYTFTVAYFSESSATVTVNPFAAGRQLPFARVYATQARRTRPTGRAVVVDAFSPIRPHVRADIAWRDLALAELEQGIQDVLRRALAYPTGSLG